MVGRMTAVAVEPTIRIREARASDTDWLVHQLRAFSQFAGTEHQLFTSADDVRDRLPALLSLGPCFLAIQGDGLPVGFVSGYVGAHPYNPNLVVLTETFWWVDPAWRGTRAGLLLLNAFLAFGEEHADWIIFTLEHHSPVNERTLTKRGFRLHELSYLKEVSR
jgi:hypothetical protein